MGLFYEVDVTKTCSYMDCYRAIWTEKEVPPKLLFVRHGLWYFVAWNLVISFPPIFVYYMWSSQGGSLFTGFLTYLAGTLIVAGIVCLLLPLLLRGVVAVGWKGKH